VQHARLYIKVVAEKEDGVKKPIDTREIAISIQLETNFWRTLVDWLVKNPEKLLVLILIPLVAYFGKKIFDKNKASKES
jgi:predicted DNA-binding ribbon-helix-helix protein